MTATIKMRAGFACLAVGLLAAGCGRSDSTDKADGATTTAKEGEAASGAFIDPAADCDKYEGTKGISGDTIKIGTVRPAAGSYAIYDHVTTGLKAYFESVNKAGGVKAGDGKTYKLELIAEDDQYDPGKTPALVKRLVEQEGVFAMVGSVGTETNLSVRDYLNDACVPSISLATGSPNWGDANDYPWYIGGLPSYALEAVRFLEFLNTKQPSAKIALLYQNDDFGKAYLGAIEKFLADSGSKMTLVAKESFDPASGQDTQAVTTKLSQSGADTFFVGIGGTPCPATLKFVPKDWKPTTYVSITCSGKLALGLAGGADEGVYSTQFAYDPGTKADTTQPAVKAYLDGAAAAGVTAPFLDGGIESAGWGFGSIFTTGLEQATTVDRAGVMNALWSLKDVKIGLAIDGVTAATDGAKDPWIWEKLRVTHREGGQWVEAAEFIDYNGKSSSLAGK